MDAAGCAQQHGFGLQLTPEDGGAWHLSCAELTSALNALADHGRERAVSGPWRNEQLDVRNAQGDWLATVERAAVRVLGIATEAVHLIASTPDGRMWVQQRAWNKPTHPGLWDTLMGGMVSAGDDVPAALARETMEEAGLAQSQLQHVRYGGRVKFACPSAEGGTGMGYMH